MNAIIKKMDHEGNGIAYIDGLVTFVPKTIPGDIVEIKITQKKKKYQKGKVLKYIKRDELFVDAFCPFYGLCGGCSLQNLTYDDTLEYKKDKLINIFKKINLDIEPIIIKNTNPQYYRNKIELKIKDSKLGFYQENTNEIVKINECMIASKCLNNVIKIIPTWKIQNGHITLRCNQNEEVLIIIDTKDEFNIDIEYLKKHIKLVGIVLNKKKYYGENYLFERINGFLFKISYDSFFQINPYITSHLFNIISDNISSHVKVLDLYSGVGTLSIVASKKASLVTGIEIIPNAVLNAINNAKFNNAPNINFVLNDVELAISKIKDKFDIWVIDPPRSGIDAKTIDVILKNTPKKLIYVSCDPQTLVRDIAKLKDKYEIEKFYILDMFSYTYHVESVCVLNRR